MAHILCLDDDMVVAQLVAEVVKFCGHHPIIETSSLDAIAKCVKDRRVKAALVDYLMPRMDGLELLSVFEEQRPEVRRVLITAAPEELAVRSAAESGRVQMVIAKPPSISDIRQAILWL